MGQTASTITLIVPTRNRPDALNRMLASVAATARRPERLEVVLVVDDDAPAICRTFPSLTIRSVMGPPGRTMGELNNAGYLASRGQYVMLMNDDVIIRTSDWDHIIQRCFKRFGDPIALVHVNDLLIRDYLCTFPVLPRAYCELIGGICPTLYERYRIDDHIEDVFNILAWVGVRRSMYLPDVIFEHCNSVIHPAAGRVYESDPEVLARDAPRFDALLPVRKQQARIALEYLGLATFERLEMLERIEDSFELRVSGRQHVLRTMPWRQRANALIGRARGCYQRSGGIGMARAMLRRLR